MKEYRHEPGGRLIRGADLEAIQETALVSEKLLSRYSNFIISGCEVAGSNISNGIVMLNGKACIFSGATNVTLPFYVKKEEKSEAVPYESGTGTGKGYDIYTAVKASATDAGAFRLDNAPHFEDIFKPKNAVNADTVDGYHASDLLETSFFNDANELKKSGIFKTLSETVNVPAPNEKGHSLVNLWWDENSGSQLFINKKTGIIYRRINDFGWKSWENLSYTAAPIDDWNNIPEHCLAAGTILMGKDNAPNSPLSRHFTAVVLSSDNNGDFANLLGVGINGTGVWTRCRFNTEWKEWKRLPTLDEVKLDIDNILPTGDCSMPTFWHSLRNGTYFRRPYEKQENTPTNGYAVVEVIGYSTEKRITWYNQGSTDIYQMFVNHNSSTSWWKMANYSDIPTSLPANGGNADTLENKHASDFICAPKELTVGTDLNSITTPGFYLCGYNAEAKTMSNSPTELAFSLLVEKHAGYKQTLTTYEYYNPVMWVRNLYSGYWGEWRRVILTEPNGDIVAYKN